MSTTDQLLGDAQRTVELDGTSHANCVYLNDLTFTLPRDNYTNPQFATTHDELFDADLSAVIEDYTFPERWKNLVVRNHDEHFDPPRVLSIQFIESTQGRMDLTVNMAHCDLYGELPDDVVAANLTLFRFCVEAGCNPGNLTFNIGVAYTLYTDMEFVDEGIVDWGD